jgi:hypothetical protein
MNRFIEHLQVVTTNNYNIIADFHTSQSLHAKSSTACTSRCLVTTLNNGDSSAYMLTSLLSGEYPTTEFSTEPQRHLF